MILTCEINKEKDTIEIIFNKDGLLFLKEIIENIQFKQGENLTHVHLRTKEWGGNELTSEVMGENNGLINHLKLVYLNE